MKYKNSHQQWDAAKNFSNDYGIFRYTYFFMKHKLCNLVHTQFEQFFLQIPNNIISNI